MLLAIDTATKYMGIALYNGTQILSESIWTTDRWHTTQLAPEVVRTFERTGIKKSKLKAIALAKGPGSFTGLRIGMAFAKGYAFRSGLPLIAIPTLDIVAAGQHIQDMKLCAVIQAGRNRLAVGWYTPLTRKWKQKGKIENLTIEELIDKIQETTLVCGELTDQEKSLIRRQSEKAVLARPAATLRRPSILAELAWARWRRQKFDDPATLAPHYLSRDNPL